MQKKITVWYTLGEAEKATNIPRTRLDHACRVGRLQYRRSETGARLLSNEVVEKLRKGGLSSFPRPYDPPGISSGDDNQSAVAPTSSALQMRRERIEVLNLEGQEVRARRELRRQRAEQAEETERLAEQERERKLERELYREHGRVERLRQEQLQQEAAAEQTRQALRQLVQLALHAALPASLSYDEQNAMANQLETELLRAGAQTVDTAAPIIRSVVRRFVESQRLQNWERRRAKAAEGKRSSALESAVWTLKVHTPGCTEVDEAKAAIAIREAFEKLPPGATDNEIRCCAKAAIVPVLENIERRVRRNQLIEAGVKEVGPYLEPLYRSKLHTESLLDSGFRGALEEAVRSRLQAELTTDSPAAVRRLVRQIVDSEVNSLD